MAQDLTEFVLSLKDIPTRRELGQTVIDHYHEQGVPMMAYHGYYSDGVPRTPASEGWPDGWANHYIQKHLEKVDPMVAFAAKSLAPVRWTEVAQSHDLSKANLAFLEEATSVIPGNGISFKVFGPNLRNAYVCLGFGPDGIDPTREEELKLQWVAQAAHLRFCELSDAAEPKAENLTPRELEVLSWISQGKSNSVIADVMDISVHTVDTHLRRIYSKFGVVDRTSAALQGQRLGLIPMMTNKWVT